MLDWLKNFLWICYWEFHMLIQVVWPPKGIMYMEEQLLQWVLAVSSVLLGNLLRTCGYIIVVMIGIVMVFNLGGFSRLFHGWFLRFTRSISVFVAWLFTQLVNLLLAWFYLIYGAVRGQMDDSNAPYCVWFHSIRGHIHFHYNKTYRPVHYRLGRWLYRKFHALVNRLAPSMNARTKERIARGLALFVILWGVWHIPYDLTH